MSILKKRPDQAIIEEVANLKGIREAFVEKDWYVVQVINAIAGVDYKGFAVVFSGGTAFSKAHKILQRFSEDVDFRVIAPKGAKSRKVLSGFKHAVIYRLRTNWISD